MGKDKIQLLNQAINAASSSLNQAKQILSEIERGGGTPEMPGLVGKYDGMFMVTEAGKKYPVPDNYSAKTKLVYGDKLKMVEGPEGRRFKLLEEMERVEQEAQLAVKDGHFEALGKDVSYRLIQGAIRYWGGEEGDKIKILLPKGGKNIPFAGLLEIVGRKPGSGEPERPLPVNKAEPPKAVVVRPKEETRPVEKVAERPVEKPVKIEEKKVEAVKPVKKEEEKPVEKAPAKEEKKEEKAPVKETKKEEPSKKTAKPIDDKEELR